MNLIICRNYCIHSSNYLFTINLCFNDTIIIIIIIILLLLLLLLLLHTSHGWFKGSDGDALSLSLRIVTTPIHRRRLVGGHRCDRNIATSTMLVGTVTIVAVERCPQHGVRYQRRIESMLHPAIVMEVITDQIIADAIIMISMSKCII